MKPHTVLLVFLHGFKGGDSTFGENYAFTNVLHDILRIDLPHVAIEVAVYPQYETRGALGDCVSRFRDWLQNQVIDREVVRGTPSPTVTPGVHVILIGHSMGGIVAAETIIAAASERPILSTDPDVGDDETTTGASNDEKAPLNKHMFPEILGLLAFDTPFLGLSPGIVAHGAEEKYTQGRQVANTVAQVWSATAGVREMIPGIGRGAMANSTSGAVNAAAGAAATAAATRAAGKWGMWGKVALAAGGAAIVAASAGAAWYNRETLSSGISWVGSHLEFVGVLGKPEDLRRRVAFMVRMQREMDVGFVNMYTQLGQGKGRANFAGLLYSEERTFCVLPTGKIESGRWWAARNGKASDEIMAHISMFDAENNEGFDKMVEKATVELAGMVRGRKWYVEVERAAKRKTGGV